MPLGIAAGVSNTVSDESGDLLAAGDPGGNDSTVAGAFRDG